MDELHHPKLAAHIYVHDMNKSIQFYWQLGLRLAFTHGDPPFYAEVGPSGARLALRLVHEAVFKGTIRQREELLSATFSYDSASELEAVFHRCEAAHATFHRRIADQPWGTREFVISDPDGNLICFASPQHVQ